MICIWKYFLDGLVLAKPLWCPGDHLTNSKHYWALRFEMHSAQDKGRLVSFLQTIQCLHGTRNKAWRLIKVGKTRQGRPHWKQTLHRLAPPICNFFFFLSSSFSLFFFVRCHMLHARNAPHKGRSKQGTLHAKSWHLRGHIHKYIFGHHNY